MLKHRMRFLRLTKILNAAENDLIFTTEFVKQILDQFWEQNFYKLLIKQFLPFIACLFTTIFYLHYALA